MCLEVPENEAKRNRRNPKDSRPQPETHVTQASTGLLLQSHRTGTPEQSNVFPKEPTDSWGLTGPEWYFLLSLNFIFCSAPH
jgi:hypothetical protein